MSTYSEVSETTLALPHIQRKHRNINLFPFPQSIIWILLGLANPWLIDIVKEPLPFQWQRFSLCFDLTTTRILISMRSTSLRRNASALTERLLTTSFSTVYSIGNQFSPVHLRDLQPWQVSCYTLFKGWLLLSQPPRCLWLQTIFTR